jgi:hypothetical protein
MKSKLHCLGYVSILCGLSLAATVSHAQVKLYGVTGQQTDNTPADSGTGFKYPDHTLFDINPSNAALTKLFTLTWVPDTQAIGYNPDNRLLYHTAGADAYRNDPARTGHDQGGPDIPGVGFQDSHYMETVDPVTGAMAGIFNANPCPNPDPTLPCFGLTAPRPDWVLPTERRNSTQTDSSFDQLGENEYHAARDLAWSAEKKLFYVAAESGIFKLTPTGVSTFLARPAFPTDGAIDEGKAIAFVREDALLVGSRTTGELMRIDPETGNVLGSVILAIPEGSADPVDNFNGLIGLAQHPETGVVYGVRNTGSVFDRELITINPVTGATKLVGTLGMHLTSITFGRASAGAPWKLYGISGQQTDITPADSGTGFKYPDHSLFEINTTTAAVTKLFTTVWVNDSQAIGFNAENNLLYHTAGAEAYRNDPLRTGHDQGGPEIPGVGYQDSQYMETINPTTFAASAIFNADPCPNPDSSLPCFGLTAPRPAWVLPTERRDSTQTDPSFRQTGENEYHAARGLAWSPTKKVFYLSDELGIFKMTPAGESTFLARPAFPTDGSVDEAKSIAFVTLTNLYVGHRNTGLLMRVNPDTGDVLGELALTPPTGGGEPADNFGGVLGLAQHPETGVLYGVRHTADQFARELVTIDTASGATTLVGNLGMHIASIAFGQAGGIPTEIRVAITNQTEGTITLSWTGGPGRYLVQKKIDIGAPTWFDVVSTTEQTATVAKDGQMGFFRIVANYTGPDVIPLTAFLGAQGEKPSTGSLGTGVANLSIAGTTVNYMVTYSGLTGDANNAHIHGVGTSQDASLPVLIPFNKPTGKSGYITGSATATAQQIADILAGKTYVNLHSTTNTGGELRGQAMRNVYTTIMNGANEKPTAVVTPGTGTAKITIYGRELKYEVSWSNLTTGANAGHIHGRADANNVAPPIVTFSGVTGATGSTTGIVQATTAILEAIVDGMAYVNIHTPGANQGGEIRGQLAPQ